MICEAYTRDLMMEGEWFNKETGLKYRVIKVIDGHVFVRDWEGDIAYEDIEVFERDYQKFREVASE